LQHGQRLRRGEPITDNGASGLDPPRTRSSSAERHLKNLAHLSTYNGQPAQPNSLSLGGRALSPDAVQRLVARYVTMAQLTCPSRGAKRVTPYGFRQPCAMQLLQAGVDTSVIALGCAIKLGRPTSGSRTPSPCVGAARLR